MTTTQRAPPDNTKNSQETDTNWPGGIRTRNLSKRTARRPMAKTARPLRLPTKCLLPKIKQRNIICSHWIKLCIYCLWFYGNWRRPRSVVILTIRLTFYEHTGTFRFFILYCNKTKLDALISQIYFWNKTLHVSDSYSVHHQKFITVHTQQIINKTSTTKINYPSNNHQQSDITNTIWQDRQHPSTVRPHILVINY